MCRPNGPESKKAGNLSYAFAQTSEELFAVFNADFRPRPDFHAGNSAVYDRRRGKGYSANNIILRSLLIKLRLSKTPAPF